MQETLETMKPILLKLEQDPGFNPFGPYSAFSRDSGGHSAPLSRAGMSF